MLGGSPSTCIATLPTTETSRFLHLSDLHTIMTPFEPTTANLKRGCIESGFLCSKDQYPPTGHPSQAPIATAAAFIRLALQPFNPSMNYSTPMQTRGALPSYFPSFSGPRDNAHALMNSVIAPIMCIHVHSYAFMCIQDILGENSSGLYPTCESVGYMLCDFDRPSLLVYDYLTACSLHVAASMPCTFYHVSI